MTSYTQNNHFATRRNSTSSPYAIPARPRANSIASTPYNIPERIHNGHSSVSGAPNSGSHSYNPRFQFAPSPGAASSSSKPSSENVPLLTREFVVRRISEGESGRVKQELKCEACGKGYKHISSLAKHLWEHTAEWNYTKKLLISKHQQVQLLEAASILVSMNENDKSRRGLKDETAAAAAAGAVGTGTAARDIPRNESSNGNVLLSPTSSKYLQSPPQYGSIPHNSGSFPLHHHRNSFQYSQRPNVANNSLHNAGSMPPSDNYHDELMSPSKRSSFSYLKPSISHLTGHNNGGYLDAPMNTNHLKQTGFMSEDDSKATKDSASHSKKAASPAIVDDDEDDTHSRNHSKSPKSNNGHEDEYEADEGIFGELE